MEYKYLLRETDKGIARIILNRPEKRNALNSELQKELHDAIAQVGTEPDIKVLILKGKGPSFCAGHDVAEEASEHEVPYALKEPIFQQRHIHRLNYESWHDVLWNLPQPVIAQVHGWCIVEGLIVAMNCDLVIAAEDAKFLYRPYGGGGRIDHLWPWLIGLRKCKELLFTEWTVTGKEAETMHMINKAVPADRLEEEVEKLAERMAAQSLADLMLNKVAVNKSLEGMGLRYILDYTNDLHCMAHIQSTTQEFAKRVREKGVKEGIAYRDVTTRKQVE